MKCDECNSTDNYFDERMGERICSNCGLVLVTESFEETTHILNSAGEVVHSSDNNKLGSVVTGKGSYKFNKFGKNSVMPKNIQNGLMHCNMTLSAVAPQIDIKDRIERVYIELQRANIMTSYPYEVRAAAIVHYVLRENGTPHTYNEIIKEYDCNRKKVSRLSRKINQFYGNRVIRQENPSFSLLKTLNLITNDLLFHNQARKVLAVLEPIIAKSDYNKGRAYYSAICWIASNVFIRNDITSVLISEVTEFPRWNIHKESKLLVGLLGFDSVKELKGKDINKIGE